MPSQILLFDQPRAAGHLLQRILSKQTNLLHLYNNFGPARGTQVEWLLRDDWQNGMTVEARAKFDDQLEKAFKQWRDDFDIAEKEGKILLVSDHIFSAAKPEHVLRIIERASADPPLAWENFTLVPDELLLRPGTIPVLTIRNPRLTVPSTYRVLNDMGFPNGSGRANFLASTTVLWIRMIYEYFVSHGIEPVVVEADDLMTDEAFARNLTTRLGFDEDNICLTWNPITDQEKSDAHPSFYQSQKYLLESSGVQAGRAAKNLNIEEEVAKWDGEFGDDAGLIREMVALAQPAYEWMLERRYRAA